MKNVLEQCNREERSKHVQHFIHRMQFLGYTQEDKVLVYKKAKKLFENVVERDRAGQCPMYRGKFWQRSEEKRKNSTSSAIGIKEEIMTQLYF